MLLHAGFLPRRQRKYFFLTKYNRGFDRREYDLSLSLTRTACQDIAVVGGVHPASVAARGKKNFHRRLHDAIEEYYERKMFAEVPCIIAHSKAIAAQIIEYHPVDREKIHVLYPPVNEVMIKRVGVDEIHATRRKYNIDEGKMTFLFPSVGHQRKGLPELINAFGLIYKDDYELLVAGENMRGYSILPKNVRYLGYIDNLSFLYSTVDYVILPSHYEPLGLVVVESLQCGTPVIVTRGVGAAELITDTEGVIMADNDPETIARTITGVQKKEVAPDFILRHGLTIAQHIDIIKGMAGCRDRS